MSALIHARNLTKSYGKVQALDGVGFDVEPGRIMGLIGPNGAGKTTVLKAILGLTPFDGSLSVLGLDPRRHRAALMRDVCFIADVATLPRWMRVRQVLDFTAGVHGRFDRRRADDALRKTQIKPASKIGELSKGMITQLHLALVMAIDVTLLILDEPTLGLDILYRKHFYETLLNDYFDEQRTILVTTHQVEEIEHILTDLMFIDGGRIVLDAPMDQLSKRYVEVLVPPDRVDQARALGAIHERGVFGKHLFLFEDIDRARLDGLGELHTPSIADLFVAKMSRSAA